MNAGRLALLFALVLGAAAASAQPTEGGLYIAGAGFDFATAAERGIAQNPAGQRFFVLALPPQTQALYRKASASRVKTRDRVLAAGGQLMVCQRDIDNRKVDARQLVPEVVPVRGWPPKGSDTLPPGERYFPGEDRTRLPASDNALRQLRSTCA